jgi:membrane fusion protein, multidrug efflux system
MPGTAVRRAAYGNSVFVVTPDEGGGAMRAHQRFLTLGQSIGEDVIVLKGLEPGERVAAAGSFKLRDGVKVMAAPPGGPAKGGPQAAAAPANDPKAGADAK